MADIPKCCACSEAKYSLNFKGLWTQQTHPKDWPKNGKKNIVLILACCVNIKKNENCLRIRDN